MYSVNNIELSFSGNPLLRGVSFVINKKDRIGLTGKNGAGKSTMLKIIKGLQQIDGGSVSFPTDATVGYLPQQMVYPKGKTVLQETLTAFEEVNNLKIKIEQLGHELAERTDYESDSYHKLIDHFTRLQDRFTFSGAEHADASAEKMLKGLGFTPLDFIRQVEEFSGGWRMRIELAKILLQTPDLLLLDEPTNHLDIESVAWLETFLKSYNGAIVLISHDRIFLDTVTDRTIEIVKGNIYDYKASYSRFVELRKERIEIQKASYLNQQKMIAETEDFIERFRYKATKAVQVQSRIKQLDKVERIEIDEEDISDIHFRFPPAPRAGDVVFDVQEITKRYGDNVVLQNLWISIERGEKIALVGKNGQGKTTFARILMQEIDYEGVLKVGHNVKIGYFAQNQDKVLDESKTVFQTLDDIAVGPVRTRIRDILGNFLFGGEDIDKRVSVLSGGERSRLALAKLMLEPYNVLILDEPTNHLDMHSKDILKQALQNYDGTLILVSHDRDFLRDLSDKILEFSDKKIKQHAGDILLFMQKKRLEQLDDLNKKTEQNRQSNAEKSDSDNKKLYLLRKEHEKKIRKAEKDIGLCESEIERLETEIKTAQTEISNSENASNPEFYKTIELKQKQLEAIVERWENLHSKLETLEKEKESL